MRFSTRAIHAGQKPDPVTGAIMTPVYLTSTYEQETPGVHKGFEYSRTGNPTRTALEQNLAALEGGRHGLCFASGLAATDAVLNLLEPGDHVVAGDDLYGGTHRIFTQVYQRFGLEFDFVDASDPQNLVDSVTEKTRMIWLETPTNPLLKITDIAEVSKICSGRSILLVVDNTFATPYLQQPLELGANIVLHSTTKYLGGHSDLVGGALITSDDELQERLAFIQNAVGAVPGPLDCFLTLRGTKTLAVRLDRHCENAGKISRWLHDDSRISRVYYPGLEQHPGHEIASRQMSAAGGMVSFVLADESEKNAREMVSRTGIFILAESLGGVESLIEHPVSMTHGAVPPDVRKAAGLSDALIRLSVGIEDVDDLIEDLDRAIG
ncbi:MAG: cystathionine gamma-synthase [Planctomycetota bacterium]|nr:MAG: cystathionine gamma-synthase [Planctomycetota bacterium]